MALPREYLHQSCSMVRTLEIIGERWTMLIVRDAFFGVRRFSDFSSHLRIPRAVLTERLEFLAAEGVLARVPGAGRRFEYALTDKGLTLWPVLRSLTEWGDEHYAPAGPRRVFTHVDCGGAVDAGSRCAACGALVPVTETAMAPGPGYDRPGPGADAISVALSQPRRLLTPILG